ncbi:MAG: NADPH:quinone oxidoreductase family protein [Polyangiaceae bacterium]|nr:NADPH:quinone oxidoreductase family protein [Polyangiaceae bacterium]
MDAAEGHAPTLPTGRRAVVHALGASPQEALEETLRIEVQPPPDPATLGPEDVVIRVRSAAVGWVDLLMTSGQYQHVPAPPYTPGLEYAGEVVWRGAAVRAPELGAKVLADGLLTGPRSLGAYRAWGGFATYAVAPAAAALPLPAGLSFDEGACLLGGTETAYHALVTRGRVRAGETVLVLGASGSTGLATVEVAKILGATVIAAGRSAEKLEPARALGADHLVVLGAPGAPRLRDAVKALTGGRGADVVYDPVGGELSQEGLRAAAFGARYLVVGWAATPLVARGGRDPNFIPTNLVLMKGLDVLGSPAAIAVLHDPALRTERLARALEWARAGRLHPHVSHVFAFDELRQALRDKWEGRHAGNLVVHPD